MRLALLYAESARIETLASALEVAGHHVHRYIDPRVLFREAQRESFDLFLLEWDARDARNTLRVLHSGPGMDCSVVFFNCRNDEGALAEVLGSGADDFIVGPVGVREVVARVGAILRQRNPRLFGSTNFLDMPPYRFDMTSKAILVGGTPVALTDKEFELALFLFRNLGRTLSRGHLLEAVWGSALLAVSRTVDTHVSRIRRKLGLRPETGFRLSAAYGNGYRLERIVDDWSIETPGIRRQDCGIAGAAGRVSPGA